MKKLHFLFKSNDYVKIEKLEFEDNYDFIQLKNY